MRRLQTKHLVLIVANVAVWAINGLAMRGNISLSAVSGNPVEIISEPSRVRINVNGIPWASGNYVVTPIVIHVPPGQNKISIMRTGYHSNTSQVIIQNGDEKQKVTTKLEASTENMRELTIDAPSSVEVEDISIAVDGGIEAGHLPLTMKDLVPGTHTLDITTGILQKKTVQCQFDVPVSNVKDPIQINVERTGKRIRFSGCRKLRP